MVGAVVEGFGVDVLVAVGLGVVVGFGVVGRVVGFGEVGLGEVGFGDAGFEVEGVAVGGFVLPGSGASGTTLTPVA